MNRAWISALGWTATGFFVASYFFDRPVTLRATQMMGALLWVIYGGLIAAYPVVAANALVMAAAAWTTIREVRRDRVSVNDFDPC
jgi:hypothetical protein